MPVTGCPTTYWPFEGEQGPALGRAVDDQGDVWWCTNGRAAAGWASRFICWMATRGPDDDDEEGDSRLVVRHTHRAVCVGCDTGIYV